MAINFQQIYETISSVTAIRNRIAVASMKAALDIYTAEAASATPNSKNPRVDLATAVARSPQQYAEQFAILCGLDSTVQSVGLAVTDAQLVTAIKSVWDLMAGVA